MTAGHNHDCRLPIRFNCFQYITKIITYHMGSPWKTCWIGKFLTIIHYRYFIIQNGFIVLQKGAIDDVINVLMKLLDKLENENQLFIGRHQAKFGVFEHTGFNNV